MCLKSWAISTRAVEPEKRDPKIFAIDRAARPNKRALDGDTAGTVRDMGLDEEIPGMVSVFGGKWTNAPWTAFKALEAIARMGGFSAPPKVDFEEPIGLVGVTTSPAMVTYLEETFGFGPELARRLVKTYGEASQSNLADYLREEHGTDLLDSERPHLDYLVGEVYYAMDREMAKRAVDFLARRHRIATVNHDDARHLAPKLIKLMGDHLDWDAARREAELDAIVNIAKRQEELTNRVLRARESADTCDAPPESNEGHKRAAAVLDLARSRLAESLEGVEVPSVAAALSRLQRLRSDMRPT